VNAGVIVVLSPYVGLRGVIFGTAGVSPLPCQDGKVVEEELLEVELLTVELEEEE
jgi:hypothetical protein